MTKFCLNAIKNTSFKQFKKERNKNMAKLLQIAQLGNPVLRKKALEITCFGNKELQELIENMVATIKDANAVGFGAPQVYESVRLIIIMSYPNPRYPKAPLMKKPVIMINPKIIGHSDDKEKDWEGTPSIPGIRALVPRYTWVKVEFYTPEGKKQTKIFKDFVARIVQHENDYLDCTVFLDKAESKDIITEKEYQKIMAQEIKKS